MATWLLLAMGAAVLVGIVSATVQVAGIAPLGIVSLLTGVVLGSVLAGIGRLANLRLRRLTLLIVVCVSLVAVAAEHAWFYRHYRLQWHRVRVDTPAVALFRPEEGPKSPLKYLAGEATPRQTVYWIVDALLLAAAATGAVAVLNRKKPTY
jgi:hypothetical protein